jgi:NADH dehydrogenase
VAHNIVATLRGERPQPFRFQPLGELALVGKRTGVARIYNFHFSGMLAWAMWRAIYWMKMPDLRQRVRILLDWVLDVALGRDIVVETAPSVPTTPPAGNGKHPPAG